MLKQKECKKSEKNSYKTIKGFSSDAKYSQDDSGTAAAAVVVVICLIETVTQLK